MIKIAFICSLLAKPELIKDNLPYICMCVCVAMYLNIAMLVYVCMYAHTKVILRGQDCNLSLLKTVLISSQPMELKHLEKTCGIHAKGS